jgi:hypothetical protein
MALMAAAEKIPFSTFYCKTVVSLMAFN